MIKVEHVSKTYKAKQGTVEAVKDVSLEISRGEIFGIIGFSGAGKSTLIRLLNGLESVTSGQISINGKDITKLKRKALLKERQKIAMIFQHFNLLWSRTVEENIAFLAAKRELLEETGYESDEWEHLLTIPSDATICDNYGYLYMAKNCRKVSGQELDETEFVEVITLSFDQIEDLLRRGKFQQAMHITAWLLAQRNK